MTEENQNNRKETDQNIDYKSADLIVIDSFTELAKDDNSLTLRQISELIEQISPIKERIVTRITKILEIFCKNNPNIQEKLIEIMGGKKDQLEKTRMLFIKTGDKTEEDLEIIKEMAKKEYQINRKNTLINTLKTSSEKKAQNQAKDSE